MYSDAGGSDDLAGQYLDSALTEARRIANEDSRDREVQRTQTELGNLYKERYLEHERLGSENDGNTLMEADVMYKHSFKLAIANLQKDVDAER